MRYMVNGRAAAAPRDDGCPNQSVSSWNEAQCVWESSTCVSEFLERVVWPSFGTQMTWVMFMTSTVLQHVHPNPQ